MIVKSQAVSTETVKQQTVSVTVVADKNVVHIPAWVADLASFRRWVYSDEFPEEGRICYLKGEVWVDMSKEQVFSHNQVKTEFFGVLGPLMKSAKLGRFFADGLRLTNEATDLSCVPDGVVIFNESWQQGRVRLVEGSEEGFVEVEGTPDVVLEIVSPSSQEKDYTTLRLRYWESGIPEYWLVDVRGERLEFDILRHGPKGFVAVRKQTGWIKSKVFGKSFRLVRETDFRGHPEFTLEVR